MSPSTKYQISPDITYSQIEESIVLLKLDNEKYYSLNEVGSRIWKLIEQKHERQAIVEQLHSEYDVSKDVLNAEVNALLEKLVAAEIIKPIAGNKN